MLKIIKSFFCDGTGEFSMMRLGVFIGLVIGCYVLFFSLHTGTLSENQEFIKWFFGIIFGSKALQSIAENIKK